MYLPPLICTGPYDAFSVVSRTPSLLVRSLGSLKLSSILGGGSSRQPDRTSECWLLSPPHAATTTASAATAPNPNPERVLTAAIVSDSANEGAPSAGLPSYRWLS